MTTVEEKLPEIVAGIIAGKYLTRIASDCGLKQNTISDCLSKRKFTFTEIKQAIDAGMTELEILDRLRLGKPKKVDKSSDRLKELEVKVDMLLSFVQNLRMIDNNKRFGLTG